MFLCQPSLSFLQTWDSILRLPSTLYSYTYEEDVAPYVIEQQEEAVVLRFEVPGHTADSLDVEVSESLVTIKSIPDRTPKGVRAVAFTANLFGEKLHFGLVSAELKNGILSVRLPKDKAWGPNKVAIITK